ncbi:MAG TPA: PQQ-dependent sugar dehydrogenase [Nitrososphaeraceae archaeon]
MKPNSILTVSVNTDSERGLLGAAAYKSAGSGKTFEFLYYTEEQEGQDLRNKVYRFEWNGSLLVNPLLVLDLPAMPGPNHDGGKLLIGSDQNLYVVIGDVNHKGKLQNINDGPDPDDTGVIIKINIDSLATESSSNPFSPSQTEDLPSRYVAYGIRNSFGLAMDPLTARLWETENGPDKYDEINYIRNSVSSGFNGGWKKVIGPISRSSVTPDQLVNFQNFKYYDPVFRDGKNLLQSRE